MARKEKIQELDVIRGLAFLAVVMQHTLGAYIRQPAVQTSESILLGMLFNISKFAVPAFVFVTGIVLFYNYFDSFSYITFIKKRAKEILVPYLLWTCIYELYSNGIPVVTMTWIKSFAKNIVLGREYYHLWFVVMIFQFYLVFPILSSIFRWFYRRITNVRRFVIVFGLLTVLFASYMWFVLNGIIGGQIHSTSYIFKFFARFIDRNFVSWLYYFLLGGIVGVSINKWREFIIQSINWNSFVFVFCFVWVGHDLLQGMSAGRVDLNYSTSLKPSMFFYSISEILIIYGISFVIIRKQSLIYSLLKWFGDYSYGAYLVHALVLIYAVKLTNYLLPAHAFLWKTFVAAGICSLAAVFFTYLISKMSYVSILAGSARKKKIVLVK
ncbi:acyltransferase [Fodinisporobacter ferrooxydans]|uniref:Acyltransferase n=1 Tax=Fodinisporobacter ferrooxydans TaxID=2901836 RepID=A0ABY4CPC5_9BACL|nr:acyltransferase [Alicyclobacillaceae bacterium MYW30-H2]